MSVLRDALYDAAYRFRKSKLWGKICDTQIFAIKLPDGEYGYVSIVRMAGNDYAIAIFVGEVGFNGYRRVLYHHDEFSDFEIVISQDCMQLCYSAKDYMLSDELKEAQAYMRKNNIRIDGDNTYPKFMRIRPNCTPWKIDTAKDAMALIKAAEVSILLSDRIDEVGAQALGLNKIDKDTKNVSLFDVVDGELKICGLAPVPGDKEITYEYVKTTNQTTIDAVRNLPKSGIWDAQLVRIPHSCRSSPNEAAYYPQILIMFNEEDKNFLPMSLMEGVNPDPQIILWDYAKCWRSENFYPKEIRCVDELTYAYLKDFSEKTDVLISLYKGDISAFHHAKEHFFYRLSDPAFEEAVKEMEKMAELALKMPFDVFRKLPDEMIQTLHASLNFLPEDLAKRLEKRLGRL
ncbi:MAG: hypothetical protein LUF29_07200 [Oscillospiraceae bacterium]|nr:hypothetical protein [Oscillospiraceae bacterium]